MEDDADVPWWTTFMEVSIAAIKLEMGEIKVLKLHQVMGHVEGGKVTGMLD